MSVEAVVPGLWLLKVTIPIPSLRHVNVYAFELADGSVGLVDTGWDDEDSWQSLLDGLAEIHRSLEDVSVIAITHAHPDHLGLATRIQSRAGARVLLHEEEHRRLQRSAVGPRDYIPAALEVFPRWGLDTATMEEWLGARTGTLTEAWHVESAPVGHGDRLDFPGWDLQVVWTPGHTPGHMCLRESRYRLLLTGDHVLGRITPGIGVHPADPGDPLDDFLASLQVVADLQVDKVLPGHEGPLTDLPGRVRELHEHHRKRLDEIVGVLAARPGGTTWDVACQLTWSRPLDTFLPAGRRLALTETQAHLVHLERKQTLKRIDDPAAGVERWIPA